LTRWNGWREDDILVFMNGTWWGERMVNVRLMPPWSWVSYVGAVTSVLRSRGVKCDFANVAGMSGYAFVVNIHPELLPFGPVAFDWEVLIEGTQGMGIMTELVAVERTEEDEHIFAELFERVRAEVDSGRCCVVWGAGSAPEFGVVYGYRDDYYLVRSSRSSAVRLEKERLLGPQDEPEEPIRFNQLNAPWRLAAVFFGESFKPERMAQERRAVARAVKLLRGLVPCFSGDYHYGAGAFRTWADVIEKRRADRLGSFYNLMCYWELQMFASGFCKRISRKWSRAKEELTRAGTLFYQSFANLEKVRTLIGENGDFRRERDLALAGELIKGCAVFNEQAANALESALGLM